MTIRTLFSRALTVLQIALIVASVLLVAVPALRSPPALRVQRVLYLIEGVVVVGRLYRMGYLTKTVPGIHAAVRTQRASPLGVGLERWAIYCGLVATVYLSFRA